MRQFEHVTKTDRHLIMINLIRLLTVVLIPLTTYIGVTYGDITLGRVLLPVNFLLLAIVSYWEWSYAVHSKSKLANKVSRDLRHQSTIRNLTIIVMAIIVIILAVYIGQLAFVIFLLIPLISNYVHRRVDLRER